MTTLGRWLSKVVDRLWDEFKGPDRSTCSRGMLFVPNTVLRWACCLLVAGPKAYLEQGALSLIWHLSENPFQIL